MKKILHTILLSILFFKIANAQPDIWKWVGASTGSYLTETNWQNQYGDNGLPALGDTIDINNGGTITIENVPGVPATSKLGSLKIHNSTSLYLDSESNVSPFSVNYFEVEHASSFNIIQNDFFLEISIDTGEIYGNIAFDSNEHKLKPASSTSHIVFKENSGFYANSELAGFPFGIEYSETVVFENESNYFHSGGLSPFGSPDLSVVKFMPESNYFINGGNGSGIYFSGKMYGNIITGSGNAIVVDESSSASSIFSFNNMRAANGSITFTGDASDAIEIYGQLIESNGGEITLISGSGFSFTGSSANITGSHTIVLECPGNTSFNMLPEGKTLTLNRDLVINSLGDTEISGHIDCRENSLQILNKIIFKETSKITSQNQNGINGSITSETFVCEDGVHFVFNGNEIQSTGLVGHDETIGKILITNVRGVVMDNNITVDTLDLNMGVCEIGDNNLEIRKKINYMSGQLTGNQAASKLIINCTTADPIIVPTPLDLNELQIIGSGTVKLTNNGLMNVNKFIQSDGQFYIDNSQLAVNEDFDIIDGIFSGGTGSLIFNSTLSGDIDIPNNFEIGTLVIYADKVIYALGTITFQHLLKLVSGDLDFSYQKLNLNGDFISEGGVLSAAGDSELFISGAGNYTTPLVFNESENKNILKNFSIEASGIVDVGTNLFVNDTLFLNTGRLRLHDANTLYVSDINRITGYVITEDLSNLTKSLVNGIEYTFHVGTELYYTPVNILPENSDSFSLSVSDSVYTEGYEGIAVTDIRVVHHTWKILSSDNTSSFDVYFNFNTTNNGTDFEAGKSKLYYFDNLINNWKIINGSNVSVTTVSFRVESVNLFGLFAVLSGINQAPLVTTPQEFFVDEHSPAETIVGELDISEPDPGQSLTVNLISSPNLKPFGLEQNNVIIVREPDMLNYSVNPLFRYNLNICDNGLPFICQPLDLTIKLNDVDDELVISNYMSPNNDNINDLWIIQGAQYIDTNVKVYNNIGNLVYESEKYKNDWNGTIKGKRLAPGVYFYSVKTIYSEHKGTLTLQR